MVQPAGPSIGIGSVAMSLGLGDNNIAQGFTRAGAGDLILTPIDVLLQGRDAARLVGGGSGLRGSRPGARG
jgi:hypothetical protein